MTSASPCPMEYFRFPSKETHECLWHCVSVCVSPTFVSIFSCTLVYLYHHLSRSLSLFPLRHFLLCLSLVLLSLWRLPSLSVAFNGALACNFICEILRYKEGKKESRGGELGGTSWHLINISSVVFCFSRPARLVTIFRRCHASQQIFASIATSGHTRHKSDGYRILCAYNTSRRYVYAA